MAFSLKGLVMECNPEKCQRRSQLSDNLRDGTFLVSSKPAPVSGSINIRRSLRMSIVLDGSSLTIEKLVSIARFGEKVELAPAALERIKVCRTMLEQKLANREIMYGTNTGIGEFSEKVLNDDQVKEFQRYLIYNHAAGIGDPAPVEHVRSA